ncbi:unnamed protein product [Strongylus vulgaris]|uniref:Uncharacterized protein n=1 Tax=Strongylus vulgaris TaxID=40348 RepID=A0A3P7LEY0_STRVU|nr:unnamed protein product [Strongylus vulgaris]
MWRHVDHAFVDHLKSSMITVLVVVWIYNFLTKETVAQPAIPPPEIPGRT